MATIRMLVAVGGADLSWHPGQLVELPADDAAKWADGVRAVYAEPVQDPAASDGEGQVVATATLDPAQSSPAQSGTEPAPGADSVPVTPDGEDQAVVTAAASPATPEQANPATSPEPGSALVKPRPRRKAAR